MRTASQVEGDYVDQLGRCEVCGVLVPEVELYEVYEAYVVCESCYVDMLFK